MIKENSPTLQTERLLLRKFNDDDIEDMFALYSDKVVNKFLPWFAFETREQTVDYLHKNIYEYYKKAVGFNYAIVLKSTNHIVGFVALHQIDEAQGTAELGYASCKEVWGNGIVAEASKAVLEIAERNGFKKISATHDINNPASGRVMQKIGMKYIRNYDELVQPKNYNVTFKLYEIQFDGD